MPGVEGGARGPVNPPEGRGLLPPAALGAPGPNRSSDLREANCSPVCVWVCGGGGL